MIRPISQTAMLSLGATFLALAMPAAAQYAERPSDRLSRHLRELATDPGSLPALIGAGQAALDVGDGNAALGFFARADERSPRNGQVKAGLARAFLMTDDARQALRLFEEAKRLGIADVQIASDRGLAHDLRGDTRRAQQDYVLALSRGPNDEVTKRYALSLGIAGDRDQALKLLDPLLYKRDQGAWRARAFVLALTGDVRGASAIVHQVMPARMAQTMDPFLAKLGALSAAQKAAAVHLGEMPSNVRFAAATVAPDSSPPPPQAKPAPAPAPAPARTAAVTRVPESREPRRRPGNSALVASPPPVRTTRVAGRQVAPSPAPTPTPTPTPPPAPAPVQIAAAAPLPTPEPVFGAAASSATPAVATQSVERRGDLEAIIRELRSASGGSTPAPPPTRPTVRLAQATPKAVSAPNPTPAPAPARPTAKTAKPDATKPEPTKADAKKAADPAKAKVAAAKKKPELPKHPSRIWVQVAGGANAAALPRAWSEVSGKATDLKGKGPWTAKNRATNRLLAGPFKSDAEAQAAVGKLRKAGVGAFQWRSEEGEAVEKLGTR